jgi:hypothetical protein
VKPRPVAVLRYEHNYFRGFVVSAKRAGKRWVRYFSDKPDGRAGARRRASEYASSLVARLPWPTRIKRRYVRNTTGVIGVSRVRERTRSGGWLVRYVAVWPTRNGRYRKASFSVAAYGESAARSRAIAARRSGLRELLKPPGTRAVEQ